MRKLTQEEAAQIFADNHCKLLGKYENSKIPVEYECECGNDRCKIRLHDLQQGEKCGCGDATAGVLRRNKLEDVQKEFEAKDCKLLTEEYIGNKSPLEYLCPICQEIHTTSLVCFRRNKNICLKKENIEINHIKLTQEEAEKIFSDKDCVLVSKYENSQQKLEYYCSCGNEEMCTIKLSDFKRRKTCACKKNNTTIEKVKEEFKAVGCELLEDTYINGRTKMKYMCNCGNKEICFITLHDFRAGRRCKECGKIKSQEDRKYTIQEVREEFEKHECTLDEGVEYKDSSTPMPYTCKCGEKSEISLNHLKRGQTCGCAFYESVEERKIKIEDVKKEFEKYGCQLKVNEYVDNNTSMKFICKCTREAEITYKHFKKTHHCKLCSYDKLRKPHVTFKIRCRSALKSILVSSGKIKNSKIEALLGYTSKDVWARIESNENWERVKNQTWQLDHIFPINAFVTHGIMDIKIINALDNLQPLTAKENLVKHHKYNFYSFKEWLKTKNIYIGLDYSI